MEWNKPRLVGDVAAGRDCAPGQPLAAAPADRNHSAPETDEAVRDWPAKDDTMIDWNRKSNRYEAALEQVPAQQVGLVFQLGTTEEPKYDNLISRTIRLGEEAAESSLLFGSEPRVALRASGFNERPLNAALRVRPAD